MASKNVVLTDVYTGESWVIYHDPLMESETWTMANGGDIAVADMEHTHLERTIMFLRLRAVGLHRRAISRMLQEESGPLGPGGDMAQQGFDYAFVELIESNPVQWLEDMPIIRAMKAELVRRDEPWSVA